MWLPLEAAFCTFSGAVKAVVPASHSVGTWCGFGCFEPGPPVFLTLCSLDRTFFRVFYAIIL